MHKVSSARPSGSSSAQPAGRSSEQRLLSPRDVRLAVATINSLYYQLTGIPIGFTLQEGSVKKSEPYILHVHNDQQIILGSAGLGEVLGTLRGIAGGLRLTAGLLDGPDRFRLGMNAAQQRSVALGTRRARDQMARG